MHRDVASQRAALSPQVNVTRKPLDGSKHPSNIDRVPDHTKWYTIADPGECNVNISAEKPLRGSLHIR